MLVFGKELRNIFSLTQEATEPILAQTDYVKNLQEKLALLHSAHRENLLEDQAKIKTQHDKKSKPHEFRIGSLVWLREVEDPTLLRRLQKTLRGPYEVLNFIHDNYTVHLRCLTTNRLLKNKIHVERLRAYTSNLTETQQRNRMKENCSEYVPSNHDFTVLPVDQTEILMRDESVQTEDDTDTSIEGGLTKTPTHQIEQVVVTQNQIVTKIPRSTQLTDLIRKIDQLPNRIMKDILDQRVIDGQEQYLVNFKVGPRTGLEFSKPIWIKCDEATQEMKNRFFRSKAAITNMRHDTDLTPQPPTASRYELRSRQVLK